MENYFVCSGKQQCCCIIWNDKLWRKLFLLQTKNHHFFNQFSRTFYINREIYTIIFRRYLMNFFLPYNLSFLIFVSFHRRVKGKGIYKKTKLKALLFLFKTGDAHSDTVHKNASRAIVTVSVWWEKQYCVTVFLVKSPTCIRSEVAIRHFSPHKDRYKCVCQKYSNSFCILHKCFKSSCPINERAIYSLKDTLADVVAAAISMTGDASLISLTTKVQLLNPKSKLLLPQVVNYHTGVLIRGRSCKLVTLQWVLLARTRGARTNLYYTRVKIHYFLCSD